MTSKLEQILQIEPQTDLVFKVKDSSHVTTYINLFNPSEKRVVYKLKTTDPKRYCVRPNCGILEPLEKAHVTVCLQPEMYDAKERNSTQKFMVQSAYAPDGEVNIDKIWRNIAPEDLMDSKLRCIFEIDCDSESDADTVVNTFKNGPTSIKTDEDIDNTLTESESEEKLKIENRRLKEQMISLQVDKDVSDLMAPYTHWSYILFLVTSAVLGVVVGKYCF